LPEEVIRELVRDTGKQVEDESPRTWLWHGRKVRVVDGSMHLVGYNLIRGVMAVAAFQSGRSPWEISFKGTLQTLDHFLPVLPSNAAEIWCET
jgi:hypothetical protein